MTADPGAVVSAHPLSRCTDTTSVEESNSKLSRAGRAVFRGSKMTFHTLKLMLVKKNNNLIDNSRRAAISESVTQKQTRVGE